MQATSETDRPSGEHRLPFLAHQFDTPRQQFQTGKLGMWLFLATEILMFSGLFCVYAVYRHNHPEVFVRAAQFLNWKLGALNTLVLICSSLTMAWAVHCAHCNQQRGLQAMLGLTVFLGLCFMGVKGIEYHDKWKHHLLPGVNFKPELGHAGADAQAGTPAPQAKQAGTPALQPEKKSDAWTGPEPGKPPAGLAAFQPQDSAGEPAKLPGYTHIFFGIYFVMTGLHGLHVLAGLGVIIWILRRARRGEFSSAYYAPVDLVGLYWHFVDIIWIYLFPLLYLVR
ncbi:MAG: cytochrome c oxidase subunit 3 family protein [Planctomycetota bacterium]